MTAWSPTTAMCWEAWRLSSRRLFLWIALTSVVGAAVLASPIPRQVAGFLVLQLAVFAAWSAAIMAIGVDVRKGFTFRLGYARPVATWKLVAVPLAFRAVSAAVAYLIPVVLLRGLFGVPFPLLPVAAICAAATLLTVASSWWTAVERARRVTVGALTAVFLLWVYGSGALSGSFRPMTWSEIFSFSLATYGRVALVCAVACVVTFVGVARQRRGDDLGEALVGGFAGRGTSKGGGLVDLIRRGLGLALPMTTPSRAQLWLEVQTVGAAILASGLRLALLLGAFVGVGTLAGLSGRILLAAGFFALVFPAVAAIRRIPGLERTQGRTRLNPYTRTRAVSTARVVALKVVVAWFALLVSWAVAVGAVWLVGTALGAGDAEVRATVADYVPDLPGGMGIAVPLVVLSVHGAGLLAWAGGLQTLFVLNGKRVMSVGLGIVAYLTVIVTLVVRGWLPPEPTGYFYLSAIALGFVVLLTYWTRRLVAQKVLSRRAAALLVGLGLTFSLATRESTRRFWDVNDPSIDEHVIILMMGLLPLGGAAFLLWAFSRLRHQ